MTKDNPVPARQSVLPYLLVRDGARALAAGAELLQPVADQPWGDRNVTLRDPFGHVWTFATRTGRAPGYAPPP